MARVSVGPAPALIRSRVGLALEGRERDSLWVGDHGDAADVDLGGGQ
jgi:hypothetical protein